VTVTKRSQTTRTVHANDLLDAVAKDPWGDVSASVYDTARLVSLTPELPGDRGRQAGV
jgi:hypothetical protein